jgi:hypothetical protein
VAQRPTQQDLPRVNRVANGQIMLGTVKPLANAAVAHYGKKTLAMLRQRPQEPVDELLG